MATQLPEHIRSIKYKVSAEFQRLRINKNIQFDTKILWKRNKNRAQTSTVTHHDGQSVFNETLTLEFAMYFDTTKSCFLQKNTEIAPVICMGGKTKSGGTAKFDVAEPLNSNFGGTTQTVEKRIRLEKCPDPEAYVDVIFHYELMDEEPTNAEMSVMNVSTQDANMSRFEFPSTDGGVVPTQANENISSIVDQKKFEIKKLHLAIDQIQLLATKLKQKKQESGTSGKDPEMNMRIQMLEGENARLRTTIQSLEEKISEAEINWRNEKRNLEKQNLDLEKMVDKKSKEISDKVKEINEMQEAVSRMQASSAIKNDDSTDGGASNSNNSRFEEMYESLKIKYEQSQKELQELRPKLKEAAPEGIQQFQMKNQSFDLEFGKEFGASQSGIIIADERLETLQKQKQDLQAKLALTSNKIGQLFNVAFQIGGAKLLDRLQTSIGITEAAAEAS